MSFIPILSALLLAPLYGGVFLIASKLGEGSFRKHGLIPFVGSIIVGIAIVPGDTKS